MRSSKKKSSIEGQHRVVRVCLDVHSATLAKDDIPCVRGPGHRAPHVLHTAASYRVDIAERRLEIVRERLPELMLTAAAVGLFLRRTWFSFHIAMQGAAWITARGRKDVH